MREEGDEPRKKNSTIAITAGIEARAQMKVSTGTNCSACKTGEAQLIIHCLFVNTLWATAGSRTERGERESICCWHVCGG